MAMVFQEPMTSLNPVFTVGDQIAEVLQLHRGLSRRAARAPRWTPCARCACRRRNAGWAHTRTNCPAGCGSG